MDLRADARYELNELGWWSNWAGVTWLSPKAYVMTSEVFNEPFFNRAGFIEIEPEWAEILSKMESVFENRNLDPHIYVQESQEFSVLRERLRKEYVVIDKMSVMEMRKPSFRGNPEIIVERTKQEDAEKWCEAYLQAFYENLALINSTLEIIRRCMRQEGVTFVSARIEKKSIVGTLVMYKKQDVLGVYCVGTVPQFRKKGVANTMMEFANDVSRDAGATMILQTMLSDRVEDLYIKLGLVPIYRKEVFTRNDHRHHLHS